MAVKEGQTPDDPKALIFEAYRMEGITEGECRTIFLDWALGQHEDAGAAIHRLLEHYGAPDHPMTRVLQQGLEAPARSGRRGGRAARVTP